MRAWRWTGGLLVTAAALVGLEAFVAGAHDESTPSRKPGGCTEATIEGAYGIQMQGNRPAGPGGPTESAIGIVIREYDGHGQIEQYDNVKGSLTGYVPDRQGFGTYQVNDDCTAVTRFEPGPGVVIEEKLVIVDGGREILGIVSAPQPVMISTVQKRVSSR